MASDTVLQGIAKARGGTILYDGDRALGFLIQRRDGGTDAVTVGGRALGRYNHQGTAALALMEQVRE